MPINNYREFYSTLNRLLTESEAPSTGLAGYELSLVNDSLGMEGGSAEVIEVSSGWPYERLPFEKVPHEPNLLYYTEGATEEKTDNEANTKAETGGELIYTINTSVEPTDKKADKPGNGIVLLIGAVAVVVIAAVSGSKGR